MTIYERGKKKILWYKFREQKITFCGSLKKAKDKKEAEKIEKIIFSNVVNLLSQGINPNEHPEIDLTLPNAQLKPKKEAEKEHVLKEAIDLYLNYYIANEGRNLKGVKSLFTNILKYWGENYPLKNFTPNSFEQFKIYMRQPKIVMRKVRKINPEYGKKGVKKQYIYEQVPTEKILQKATINRHIEVLKTTFKLCIAEKYIKENPIQDTKKFTLDNTVPRYLTDEESILVANTFKKYSEYNDPDKLLYLKRIILLDLLTGMRASEIVSLRWSINIKLDEGYIHLLKTKTNKERKIPLSPKAQKMLEEMKKEAICDFVFPNPKNKKIHIKSVKTSYKTFLKRAGIEKFRFHDIRHTTATNMSKEGVELIVMQDILGHKRLETTKRYTHAIPERKILAAQKLDNNLFFV